MRITCPSEEDSSQRSMRFVIPARVQSLHTETNETAAEGRFLSCNADSLWCVVEAEAESYQCKLLQASKALWVLSTTVRTKKVIYCTFGCLPGRRPPIPCIIIACIVSLVSNFQGGAKKSYNFLHILQFKIRKRFPNSFRNRIYSCCDKNKLKSEKRKMTREDVKE